MIFNNLNIVVQLGFRSVLRNPRRSAITFLAIVVGIWSSVALASLARGISEQMAQEAIRNFTGHIQIHAPKFLDDPVLQHSFDPPSAELAEILNQPQIKGWTVRIRVPAVVQSEREVYGVTLLGVEPAKEKKISVIGEALTRGRYLESSGDNGLLLGKRLVEQLETKLDRRVVVMSENINHEIADRGFRIVGLFETELEATEKSYAIAGLDTVQRMLDGGNRISEISILAQDRKLIPDLVRQIQSAVPELDTKTWQEVEPLISALMKLQGGFLKIWFLIVIVTIAFGLVNTLFMAIFERYREIGLMQALGMKPYHILFQVLVESTLLLLSGIAAGNLLGAATVYYFRDGLDVSAFASAAEFLGIESRIYPHIISGDWISANLMISLLGLLAAFYPAWKASRLTPVDALRKQ